MKDNVSHFFTGLFAQLINIIERTAEVADLVTLFTTRAIPAAAVFAVQTVYRFTVPSSVRFTYRQAMVSSLGKKHR